MVNKSKKNGVKTGVVKKTGGKLVTKKVVQKANVEEPKENEFMVTVSRLGLKKAVDMVANALPGKEYNDAKSGIFLEAKIGRASCRERV